MRIGTLEARCPWGMLLVTDVDSDERIPAWSSEEEQVTSSRSALVVRVKQGDDGPVRADVWDGAYQRNGYEVFCGILRIPSGVVRVSDALGEQCATAAVAPGSYTVRVFLNELKEAAQVDLVLAVEDAGQ